ncbi:MAG: MFS transporter [Planctomycetes bacterium]|nr:MFS transporter [Planctomycetota bacterium]
MHNPTSTTRGQWLALTAALLGWMFDGFEMGLFPVVARRAIRDLLGNVGEDEVGKWMGLATACFLVGAASGGVLFGWLGDRLGRVRAMTLSVVMYSLFTGLCAFAQSPAQVAALRFISALGMGGEWALGVALVMEIWPDKSRAFLAGLIGAAANVGFLLVFAMGGLLAGMHWRWQIGMGAVPALLAFFIRIFVPESQRWQEESRQGRASHWNPRDLGGVGVGVVGVLCLIFLWATEMELWLRIVGSVLVLTVSTLGFLFPVFRYLQRMRDSGFLGVGLSKPIGRMLLGAGLSGIPLMVTWASTQWGPLWAEQLAGSAVPRANAYTGMVGSVGAVIGTLIGAYLGNALGRRITYFLLCIAALGSSWLFFKGNEIFDGMFLASFLLVGVTTAAFYGWLPLYLPELFASGMRATGQGFSYNFGRILAAVGALQTGYLMQDVFDSSYPLACSTMSLVYIAGMALIWLAPETKGQPLPE